MMQRKINKTSAKFSLLLITFILPVIISWILFYYHEHFHFNTTNHGTLINPPIPVENLLQNKNSPRTWQIVYVPKSCIAGQCENMMLTLSQLRKALGKDYERVSLVLITVTSFTPKQAYGFRQLSLTQHQSILIKNILKQKINDAALLHGLTDKIYLIDPVGNLFMYYSSSANPMDILKDLKHLLGVSQIG